MSGAASAPASIWTDIGAIVAAVAAGGPVPDHWLADGRLYVVGVTQAALDAAVAQVGTDPPPAPRVVDGAGFLALFTPAEVAALWTADPRLMAGALKVAAQNSCNLASPECAGLLALAVAKGVLTEARAARVIAGLPPA